VHYLTKAAFRPILAANPYVDKIHCLEGDLDGLIAALKSEDFDYVIDLHHNLRTLRSSGDWASRLFRLIN